MQCLQASHSNGASCYGFNNGAVSSTPFRSVYDGEKSESQSSLCSSMDKSWLDIHCHQHPKIKVQEESSMNMRSRNLKKRKIENGPNVEKKASKHFTEDDSNKKLKETKQSNTKKESHDDATKEQSKTSKTDYIHVRARRGQATDSHSLAERVRRERISERMKYLQELVPGCNKITGKAGMLDEIINYVQSLQRQVEFLSMKLAVVNPTVDFSIDNFLNAELINPVCSSGSLPVTDMSIEQLEQSLAYFNSFQQANACPGLDGVMNAREMVLQKALSSSVAVPQAFWESCLNVQGPTWDTSLHNLYEFNQGKLPIQSMQGTYFPNHLKMEM